MSKEVDIITTVHTGTKRDYLGRVTTVDKAAVSELACKFDKEYWDGTRDTGYGGYKYDGRWKAVAEKLIAQYGLTSESRILDVGCGKGFLLYELSQLLPGCTIAGIDISSYAIQHAKEEVSSFLKVAPAQKLPFKNDSFDFVFSLNTIHNLLNFERQTALKEIERVCPTGKKYIVVESYRNEREKVNLMYWQLTCRAFLMPAEWKWEFAEAGYAGDYGFIYFE